MTAKEKAKELVDKYVVYAKRPTIKGYTKEVWIYEVTENAKQCALICVDEMMKYNYDIDYANRDEAVKKMQYLKDVKQEIEKL